MARSRNARECEKDEVEEEDREANDLVEFHTSSPQENVPSEKSTASTRASRRHSSVVNNLDSNMLHTAQKVSISRRGDRRRGSTLSSTGKGDEQASKGTELSGIGSVGRLQSSAPEQSVGRGERSANRRRSMMV